MSAPQRRARETLLASAFFLAATVLLTWPQALHLSGKSADLFDAKLSAWILHWDYVQTLRDPLNLFQAPILYPAKYVLAFSENLYGAAVFGFPLLAAGASLLCNYNVVLLTGMFLSAISAWALARYVTGDALASLVAGLVYAFLPYKLSQLAHIHMEWGPFLCLVFLYLLRYLDGGRRRDAVLLALFFAWNVIACIQYAFFTGFLVAVVLVLEAATGGPGRGQRIRGALVAMGVAGVACIPFLLPYHEASQLYGMRRSISEMAFFSAKPGYFLSAGERNRLWGPLTTPWRGYEGDFFPGLAPLALAAFASRSLKRPRTGSTAPVSSRRLLAARGCDGLIALLAALWVVASVRPHLRIGPVSIGDSGRVVVFLTMAVLLRLALAFPARAPFASLSDFLRRCGLDRRALLLIAVAATGVVVSLGANTPYYRFLFTSFGAVFRAIRVAARGVVLFQVALAVLAAWGLSLWTRGKTMRGRAIRVAASLALIGIEYRAFPIVLYDYDARPVPVYEWLKTVEFPGGVVEWPLGFPHDTEYTLRQAEHEKPLVNGHSSFSPQTYGELMEKGHLRPIPDDVWTWMAKLEGSVLLFHPHESTVIEALPYRRAVRRGLATGEIELLGSFPHAGTRDFVFRLTRGPRFAPKIPASADDLGALENLFAVSDAQFARPFGVIDHPPEGSDVVPGSFGFGWALDDSGIANISVSMKSGQPRPASLGGNRPDIERAYPDYGDAVHAGFGFTVPDVAPGAHTLVVTLVGRDGGRTVLRRHVNVR